MKVFLSTGFAGKTKEYVYKRLEAMKKTFYEHIDEIDKIVDCDSPIEWVHNYDYNPEVTEGQNKSLVCLGEAIKKIAECDIVMFDVGYRPHRGCMVEYITADAYNKHMIYPKTKNGYNELVIR